MGESAPRRSTLVSRLPIFRRSGSKKQDSLPSSPSSGGVGNGVHTSSPSSTNSSSGSTGKRRSLFRAPSLSFVSKRHSEPRVQPPNLNLTPPLTTQGGTDANGNERHTGEPVGVLSPSVSADGGGGGGGGGGRTKSRSSFGFGSNKQKKITRSLTEDFDKASSSSSSSNRNVFTNCISSSGTNEGDDSGFLDDYSRASGGGGSGGNRHSSRHKKQLLPKSFSAHHRFSRTSDHHRPPEVTLEPATSQGAVTGGGGLTPASCPGDLLGAGPDSSLQSPMFSEDRTTAASPSEFVPVTEDSVSEVEALPAPSPASAAGPGPPSPLGGGEGNPAAPPFPDPDPASSAGEGHLSQLDPSSQAFSTPAQSCGAEPPALDASTAHPTDYDMAVSQSDPDTAVPCLARPPPPPPAPPPPTTPPPPSPAPPTSKQPQTQAQTQAQVDGKFGKADHTERRRSGWRDRKWSAEDRKWGYQTETTSESEACAVRSEGWHPNPERGDRSGRNAVSVQEVGRGHCCGHQEHRPSHLRKPHAASMCSGVSPYHGVMRMERRLRSSSEGAGGPRIQGNHADAHAVEGCGLLKHRNNSTSSKLGSLDMLNNMGSSELDEDDLMLDLDLSDDQRHRHVSREDSSQSLASCLNLLHSPLEGPTERPPGRETLHRQPSRPTSLLPTDWTSALGLGKEEEALPPGLEALPLRLMQQDCTSVKTLLLRLKRTLQESTETSPASSLQSLPISPCSEKSLPLKDICREEALLQQLREKDDIILHLQKELDCAKAALRSKDCQTTDRTTQTEHTGPEAIHPGRWAGLGSSSSLALRERRGVRVAGGGPAPLGGDQSSQPAHHLTHHHHHQYPPRPPAAPERQAAREERYCQGILAPCSARPAAPSQGTLQNPAPGSGGCAGPASGAWMSRHHPSSQPPGQTPPPHPTPCGPPAEATPSPDARLPDGPSFSFSSSESLAASRRADGGPSALSQIPRVGGAASGGAAASSSSTSSSLHSLGGRGSPSPPTPAPAPPRPSSTTSTTSSSSSSSSSSLFAGRLGQPPRGPLSLHSYSRKNVFLQHSLHSGELQALAHRDG